ICPDGPGIFENDPVQIIRMFQLAEENQLLFHPDAMQWASRTRKLITKEVREEPRANQAFLDLLTSRNSPERTLRKMNEAGVLGRFIPAFGKVVAMMQFNMYHHFTVDEHLLRTVGVLSQIEKGEAEDKHPLANEVIADVMGDYGSRVVLYLAALLHDVAKGRPEDHSIAGARLAKRICPRLGLDEHRTARVAWLIENHLLMSETAQSRDLNDAKTIADFAAEMQTLERMKQLLVLTVCDIRAVGPGVWNGWKGQLLRTLYYEAEPHLTGGFTRTPRRQRVAAMREELRAALQVTDGIDAAHIADLHYDNYLLSVELDNQIRHAKFIAETDAAGRPVATHTATRDFEAITEITLIAPDHPRLLSTITGVCAAAGANIEDAEIYTMKDGRALDSIFIRRLYDDPDDEQRRARNIADSIEKVLRGEKRLSDLESQRSKPARRQQAFKVTPKVTVDNAASNKFTMIEMEALDRPGVLSRITDTLADLSLDIASAHITTYGEKFVDTFYVTDLVGSKIENGERLTVIRETLLEALETNTHAKPKRKPSVSRPPSKPKGGTAKAKKTTAV
ncbi:MAG: [protein-PII] uridylyltransferase, partial [Pseudomonadota bacterium]